MVTLNDPNDKGVLKGHGLLELAWCDFKNLHVFLKIPTDGVCVKRLALSMLALA